MSETQNKEQEVISVNGEEEKDISMLEVKQKIPDSTSVKGKDNEKDTDMIDIKDEKPFLPSINWVADKKTTSAGREAEPEDDKQELVFAIRKGNIEEVTRLLNNPEAQSLFKWKPGYNLLQETITKKRLELAKLLINYNCTFSHGYFEGSVLNEAVIHGDFELIKILVKRDCPLKVYSGKSPIHYFAERNPVDEECTRILIYLLGNKACINTKASQNFTPIHFAAQSGNTEMISLLLGKKSHLNGKTYDDQTPLHLAAVNGHAETVRVLLQKGAKHNITDHTHRTPLCLAVEKQHMTTIEVFLNYLLNSHSGTKKRTSLKDAMLIHCAIETKNKSLIEMLLQKGANPNINSLTDGKTPLQTVVESGSEDFVKLLLQYNANPNAAQMRNPHSRKYKKSTGITSLHTAVEMQHLEILNILLQNRAKPGLVDEEGRTPLHLATTNGSLPIISALLNSKYKVSSLFTPENTRGFTPLHIAVENRNEEFVQLFLEKGIPVDATTKAGFTSLHLAAKKCAISMVQLLLKFGANPSAKGPTDIETPMYFAAKNGSSQIVEILSEVSRDRKQKWFEGYVSLYAAAYYGYELIVKFLLERGVDPNANFGKFLSPLHAAAQQGHQTIFNILLEKGAEVNPRSEDKFSTPLIAAALNGHEVIVEILLNQGADINVKINLTNDLKSDSDLKSDEETFLTFGYPSYKEFSSRKFKSGYMPIHFAAESGKKSIVEMILNRGAEVNAKAESNTTPLYIAVTNKYEDVVANLLKNGADPNAEESGKPVLFEAIVKKNLAIVEMLLNYKAPVNFIWKSDWKSEIAWISDWKSEITWKSDYCYNNSGEGCTPLHLAVTKSSAEIVNLLLQRGAEIDRITDQDIPLHLAAEYSSKEIVTKLIESGACIDSVCSEGLTPLFHSLSGEETVNFKLLLEKGASFDKRTDEGLSLLNFALEEELDQTLIKLIIECGGDVNERNEGKAPIERVIRDRKKFYEEKYGDCHCSSCGEEEHKDDSNYHKLVRIFFKHGLEVNTKIIETEETLLHLTARTRNTKIAKILIRHGADVNLADGKGHSPLWYAVKESTDALEKLYSERYEFLSKFETDEEGRKIPNLDDPDQEENFKNRRSQYAQFQFDEFGWKCRHYKAVARLVTQAIAKMEAGGKDVSPENLVLINGKFLKKYFTRCRKEIEEMKEEEVHNRITYFDILMADEGKLAVFARNKELVRVMESEDKKKCFPVYWEDLKLRIARGVNRKNLMEKSESFLDEALRKRLPSIIVQEIFNYLTTVDLRNFCRARKPFMFLTPDNIFQDIAV